MLNVVVLMGRLVADPELRHTPNDVAVTSFRIAVDRAYSKSGTDKQADFIDITAWRQMAEFVCRNFTKGSMIAVQGSLRVDNYTNRDGNKRTRYDVQADNVSFCGGRKESNTESAATSTAPPANTPATPAYSSGAASDFQALPDDDDLPF